MTKDNFDDFICWDMIIDGDVLRKQIEMAMKKKENLTEEKDNKIYIENKESCFTKKIIAN